MNDKDQILQLAHALTNTTNAVKDRLRGRGVSREHGTENPNQITIMLGTDRGFLDTDEEAGVFHHESPGDTYRTSWSFEVPIAPNGDGTYNIQDIKEKQSIMDGYDFKAEMNFCNGNQSYDLYYSAMGRDSRSFTEELLRKHAELRNLIDRLEFLEGLMVDAMGVAMHKYVNLKPHYFHHLSLTYSEYVFPADQEVKWEIYPFIA